jgi:isocitrate/isopropylmalate dehydrogenase
LVAAVLRAIETVLARGRSLLTLDMGGTATTTQLGTAISDQISRR